MVEVDKSKWKDFHKTTVWIPFEIMEVLSVSAFILTWRTVKLHRTPIARGINFTGQASTIYMHELREKGKKLRADKYSRWFLIPDVNELLSCSWSGLAYRLLSKSKGPCANGLPRPGTSSKVLHVLPKRGSPGQEQGQLASCSEGLWNFPVFSHHVLKNKGMPCHVSLLTRTEKQVCSASCLQIKAQLTAKLVT